MYLNSEMANQGKVSEGWYAPLHIGGNAYTTRQGIHNAITKHFNNFAKIENIAEFEELEKGELLDVESFQKFARYICEGATKLNKDVPLKAGTASEIFMKIKNAAFKKFNNPSFWSNYNSSFSSLRLNIIHEVIWHCKIVLPHVTDNAIIELDYSKMY
jgi:hypothetical protein